MKNIVFAVALSVWIGLAGCYRFAPTHPEKNKDDYARDRARCEQEARISVQESLRELSRRDNITGSDETQYVRRCMGALGWEYSLKKTGN